MKPNGWTADNLFQTDWYDGWKTSEKFRTDGNHIWTAKKIFERVKFWTDGPERLVKNFERMVITAEWLKKISNGRPERLNGSSKISNGWSKNQKAQITMNKSAAVSIFEYRIMNESKACIIADRFETN